jgi:hypothetical protein
MRVTLLIFITGYDLQHATHRVHDGLGMHTFFLFLEMILFLVELVFWVGGDSFILGNGLSWLLYWFSRRVFG